MKKIIVSLLFLSSSLVYAQAPSVPKLPTVTRGDIQMMVSTYAFIYDVPESVLHRVLHCESTHNPNAENINEWEESYGLSQINLKAHPDISKEEALDPDFAIRYMASEIAQGRGRQWTCYR